MDKSMSEQLKGFEAVWKRVATVKDSAAAANAVNIRLMPKKDNCSRAVRFAPGHR